VDLLETALAGAAQATLPTLPRRPSTVKERAACSSGQSGTTFDIVLRLAKPNYLVKYQVVVALPAPYILSMKENSLKVTFFTVSTTLPK
jgi:hypothetical protein